MKIDRFPVQPLTSRSDRRDVSERNAETATERDHQPRFRTQRRTSDISRFAEAYQQRQDEVAGLPRRGQIAISAYLSSQPSISERLGVELVGVDERV